MCVHDNCYHKLLAAPDVTLTLNLKREMRDTEAKLKSNTSDYTSDSYYLFFFLLLNKKDEETLYTHRVCQIWLNI